MKVKKLILPAILLTAGILLSLQLVKTRPKTPFESSLAPLFQVTGIPMKTMDRALSRIIPVNAQDEALYGAAIKLRYRDNTLHYNNDYIYVNQLMSYISEDSGKPFEYEVFIMNTPEPNAFALPGGVIFVTTGLLYNLETEGELISVLAHEMGHIELGHCFDYIRLELMGEKLGNQEMGAVADFIVYNLSNYHFNTTLENEADAYSFSFLKKSVYDPSSLALALEKVNNYDKEENTDREYADIIRDYTESHPPMELRINQYSTEALIWKKLNPEKERIMGSENLKSRNPAILQ